MIRGCGGNRGQIAPLVVIILAVLALLTAAVVTLSHGQKRAGVFYSDRIQAYYIAEDGVEEVLAGIFNDWGALAGIPVGPTCQPLAGVGGGGLLEVRGCQRPTDDGDGVELRLETTGRHRNAVRHVVFEAVLYPPGDQGDGDTIGADCSRDESPAREPEPGSRMDIKYWGDMYNVIYGRMRAGG